MKLLTPVHVQKCTCEVKHGKCSSEVIVKIERRIPLLFSLLPSDVHKSSNIFTGNQYDGKLFVVMTYMMK